MNSVLSYALLFFTSLNLILATSPPIKLYRPYVTDNTSKMVASKALDQLRPFFGTSEKCKFRINKVYDTQLHVSEYATIFKFVLSLSSYGPGCIAQTKTCTDVKVFIPTRENCDDPSGACYNLTETEDIQCIPDLIVEPPMFMGKFSPKELIYEEFNPYTHPMIEQVAEKATQFLYHKFNTSKTCPIFLSDVVRAKKAVVKNGIFYELELNLETNEIEYECSYISKHCTKVKVFQPVHNLCPNGRSCLFPVQLNEVDCFELPQIFH